MDSCNWQFCCLVIWECLPLKCSITLCGEGGFAWLTQSNISGLPVLKALQFICSMIFYKDFYSCQRFSVFWFTFYVLLLRFTRATFTRVEDAVLFQLFWILSLHGKKQRSIARCSGFHKSHSWFFKIFVCIRFGPSKNCVWILLILFLSLLRRPVLASPRKFIFVYVYAALLSPFI